MNSPQQGAFRRLVNLGLLIGGFGLGQGSIFLAQTWLVAQGNMPLLALFGTHFSFAMLGIIAVEAGSLTVMSANIARILHTGGPKSGIWTCYWETTTFRLTVALVAILGALIFDSLVTLPAFSQNYLLYGLPALVIWSFNAAGFLDGLQKSGISGLTGSIAYIASAVALFYSAKLDPAAAGRITGLALTCGYAVTVLAQFAALIIAGWRPQWVRPSSGGVRRAFVEESSMLMGLLPGQLYFRAQLAIAQIFLGTNATAMLVYAKQIIGAVSQVAGFARRIEFPRLVHAVTNPDTGVRQVLLIQRISFAIAGLLTSAILAASFVVVWLFSGFTQQVWAFLAIFCLTILSESLGQALVQGLFARSRYHAASIARVFAVALAVVFAYVCAGLLGIYVFILADFISHATVIGLSLWQLTKESHVNRSA